MRAIPPLSPILALLVLVALPAGGGNRLWAAEGRASLGLETRHVYRGLSPAGVVVVPAADFFANEIYGGFWGAVELESGGHDEFHLYLGTYQSVHPLVSVDAGAQFSRINGSSEPELYAGAVLEYLYRPSLYLYRNFRQNAWFAEISIRERLEWHHPLTFDWKLSAGTAQPADRTGWTYLQAEADWVYPLADDLELRLGLRGLHRDVRLGERRGTYLWAGLRLDYDF